MMTWKMAPSLPSPPPFTTMSRRAQGVPRKTLRRRHTRHAPRAAVRSALTPRHALFVCSAMKSSVNKLEQQIADLQRGHDTRFADLHKDLAGIVWELSKLRA